ncbi:MAG: hypothetical protein QXV17_10050 [Candidatus Micrarchaeaceae archaeon]
MLEYGWKEFKHVDNAIKSLSMSTSLVIEINKKTPTYGFTIRYSITGLNGDPKNRVIRQSSDTDGEYPSRITFLNYKYRLDCYARPTDKAGSIPIPIYRIQEIWNRMDTILGNIKSAITFYEPVVWVIEERNEDYNDEDNNKDNDENNNTNNEKNNNSEDNENYDGTDDEITEDDNYRVNSRKSDGYPD